MEVSGHAPGRGLAAMARGSTFGQPTVHLDRLVQNHEVLRLVVSERLYTSIGHEEDGGQELRRLKPGEAELQSSEELTLQICACKGEPMSQARTLGGQVNEDSKNLFR